MHFLADCYSLMTLLYGCALRLSAHPAPVAIV